MTFKETMVRRERAVNQPYPEILENTLFKIPDPYNVSSMAEQFVHYDNRKDDRLIILGMRESLQFLQNSENWFMDGTFSTSPPQFAQIYAIHGLNNGKTLYKPTACLPKNEWKHTWSCFLKSNC